MSSNVSPNFVDPEEYITDDVTYVMKSSSAVIAPLTLKEPVISTFLVADHIEPVCANIESPDEPLEPLEPELPDVPLDPEVPEVPPEPDDPDPPLEPDVPDVADVYDRPPIVTPFVKLAEPDTIISSPKTTLLPPELNILDPSCSTIFPLTSTEPVVGSINILPPPDDFN